jgi:hypothetical protein
VDNFDGPQRLNEPNVFSLTIQLERDFAKVGARVRAPSPAPDFLGIRITYNEPPPWRLLLFLIWGSRWGSGERDGLTRSWHFRHVKRHRSRRGSCDVADLGAAARGFSKSSCYDPDGVRALGAHGHSRRFGRVSPISGYPQQPTSRKVLRLVDEGD